MKVLNLYAGIGGNRKLWENVEVTAIEWDKDIAKIYQDFFPDDVVIVADAHQYLLDHYKEFDFIWSSPPCPSHSDMRRMAVDSGQTKPIYPDMKLYEEIIFLKQYCKGKYVVENVKPYYEPLIKPQMLGRHCFWSNLIIPKIKSSGKKIREIGRRTILFGFDLRGKKIGYRHDQILRNCVDPIIGEHIIKCAYKIKQQTLNM